MSLRDAIYNLMRDGKVRTLFDIREVTGGSDSGISAKLRQLRLPEYGGHTLIVEAPYRVGGPYTYRLIVKPQVAGVEPLATPPGDSLLDVSEKTKWY